MNLLLTSLSHNALGLTTVLCLLLPSLSSHAQTFRLDDSTSPHSRVVPRFVVDESGNPWSRAIESDHAILRYGRVDYRLDMRPHIGEMARIYFVRAPHQGRQMGTRLNWKSTDSQLSGSLVDGERALIWSGKVDHAWKEISLQLEVDFNLLRWRSQSGNSGDQVVTWFELER